MARLRNFPRLLPYRPKRITNRHSIPSFPFHFKNRMLYKYMTSQPTNIHIKDGGSRHLRNVGSIVHNHMVQHPKRELASINNLREILNREEIRVVCNVLKINNF
jgi:hypothetical protein